MTPPHRENSHTKGSLGFRSDFAFGVRKKERFTGPIQDLADATYLRSKNGRAQSEGKSPFRMRFSLGFQLPICKPDGRLDRKKSFKQAGAAGVTGVQSGPLRLTYAFQSGISRLFASSRAAKTPLRRYVASADLLGGDNEEGRKGKGRKTRRPGGGREC